MRWKGLPPVGILMVAALSCGVHTSQSAKRSLLGVSEYQLLIDAQHVMATEGIEVEGLNVENGEITSQWKTKARKQLKYTVKISKTAPPPETGTEASSDTDTDKAPIPAAALPAAVTLEVTVQRRDKTVKGWGAPFTANPKKAADLADQIVSLSVSRFEHPEVVAQTTPSPGPEKPELKAAACESTAGCDAGLHCAGGRCVSECDTETPCPGSEACDPRGRCIPKPEPSPETPLASDGTVDAELPYDLKTDKKSTVDAPKEKKRADQLLKEEEQRERRMKQRPEREASDKAEGGKVKDAD